jgi:hypothetical protein
MPPSWRGQGKTLPSFAVIISDYIAPRLRTRRERRSVQDFERRDLALGEGTAQHFTTGTKPDLPVGTPSAPPEILRRHLPNVNQANCWSQLVWSRYCDLTTRVVTTAVRPNGTITYAVSVSYKRVFPSVTAVCGIPG